MGLIVPRQYSATLPGSDDPVFVFRPATCAERWEVDDAYTDMEACATQRDVIDLLLPLIVRQLQHVNHNTIPIHADDWSDWLLNHLEYTQIVELYSVMRAEETLSVIAKKNCASPQQSDGESSQ